MLYARFIPRSDGLPSPVEGWYHFGHLPRHHYTELPPNDNLLALTPEQWEAHFENPSGWAVQNGKLVPHVRSASAPHPRLRMRTALTDGVKLICRSNSSLNAVYAVTDQAWTEMSTELHLAAAAVDWQDTAGKHHTFLAREFTQFVSAAAAWRSAWRKFADGLTNELPTGEIEII